MEFVKLFVGFVEWTALKQIITLQLPHYRCTKALFLNADEFFQNVSTQVRQKYFGQINSLSGGDFKNEPLPSCFLLFCCGNQNARPGVGDRDK